MLCEWYDYRKTHNVRDSGFKALVTRLEWDTHYGAGDAFEDQYGRTQFSKWSDSTTIIPPCNFPHYRPWGWGNFKPETDLYPFDSIFGYQITGTTSYVDDLLADNDGIIAMNTIVHARSVTFYNPLPWKVIVGDDVWIPDPTDMNHKAGVAYHTAQPYSVHQIESISADRTYVTFDYPIGLTFRQAHAPPSNLNLPTVDLIITNRRVPFQSRSVTWGNLQHVYHSTAEGQTSPVWTIEIGEPHNASVGGYLNGSKRAQSLIRRIVTKLPGIFVISR